MTKLNVDQQLALAKLISDRKLADAIALKFRGEQGMQGETPKHKWVGTSLQFSKDDGTWGELIDLKGDKGDKGEDGKDFEFTEEMKQAIVDAVYKMLEPEHELFEEKFSDLGTKIEEIKEEHSSIVDTIMSIETDEPSKIVEKLESLTGDDRLDKSAIKGLESTLTQLDLDRAISILDKRTQYLINKRTVSTGGISDGDFGDITVSGSGTTWTIDNLAVTNAKINDVAWSKITGTPTTLAGYGITDAIDGSGTTGRIAFFSDTNTLTTESRLTYDSVNGILGVHKLAGDATDGLTIESANGTDIGILGAGNTANVTWYGSHNFDTLTADKVALIGTSKTLSSDTGSDLTVSAGAISIANDAVTFAKMQNIATDRLLGRDTAGSGNIEELTVGGGIEFTGTGIQTSAFTGDVTKSAGGTAMTIANDAVTYAKMQNISATSRILGRKTAGSGDTEECTLSEVLDFIGSAAQGDILYRDASAWTRLGAGTSGQFLRTQGTGANPQWATDTGYCMDASATQASIADATTYYFGNNAQAGFSTTADIARFYIPRAGVVKAIYVFFHVAGTLASTEDATVSFRLNNTTDTTISSTAKLSAVQNVASNTGLSISVAQGDYFEIKFVAPTYVTNPTNVRPAVVCYVEAV